MPAASPGSSGVVSSRRSNTAATDRTLANGSQFQAPADGSFIGSVWAQLHQWLALASRQTESGGMASVPASASADLPIGRQASPVATAPVQSGVPGVIIVENGPPGLTC